MEVLRAQQNLLVIKMSFLMKRYIVLLLLIVSSQTLWATQNGGSLVLSASVAAAAGGVTYLFLGLVQKKSGFNHEKLGWFLVNTAVATLIPGLLAADYNDDGKINGSVLKDVFNSITDEESLKRAGKVLIFEKTGIVNVATAFAGVIAAAAMFD